MSFERSWALLGMIATFNRNINFNLFLASTSTGDQISATSLVENNDK